MPGVPNDRALIASDASPNDTNVAGNGASHVTPVPAAADEGCLFRDLTPEGQPRSALRSAITAACRRPEPECVGALLEAARLAPAQAREAQALARRLATRLRARRANLGREGLVQGLVQEFSLSSQEGVALMCLAEALLRIPDNPTRDALIRDKIAGADWQSHLHARGPLFVNAAAWGLIVTGKLVSTHSESGLAGALARVLARGGEPVIRKGMDRAMRLMGEQFVTGETIDEALERARKREAQGFRHSYDMLGEAALTDDDAQRYLASYMQAIHAIGKESAGRGIYEGPGISIKLSALHPRYSRAQRARVMSELYPRLRNLAVLARSYDIGLNIDAEEADRLELSLDLLEALCFESELEAWNGIGFVVQAYQKRCPQVLDWLIDLARRSRRRLMVRLVKGAYWDSEIKRAQVDGLEGYPVFTRKAHTDLSYIACACKLLGAAEAIYPQFATHNAHTLAAIVQLAGPDCEASRYEFQCLHGMGEPLYEQVVQAVAEGGLERPCRIYAPVGTHETLLAYLVRRLLENGANTSFVNRIGDESIPIDELIADPVTTVEGTAAKEGTLGLPHPAIPLPRALYGDERVNSAGIDLSSEDQLAVLAAALRERALRRDYIAAPVVGETLRTQGAAVEVRSPADRRDVIGHVFEASAADVVDAHGEAQAAAAAWAAVPPAERAAILERAADQMEHACPDFVGLLVREAGKTCANAIAEVREAVDFLRYYASQVRRGFSNEDAAQVRRDSSREEAAQLRRDPSSDDVAQVRGDSSNQAHRPLGLVTCISPWNFPLAIFTGQIAAALATGNAVLAKPAEQTPLVAAEAVRLLRRAGVPPGALQLLPGPGETVGAKLVADERIRGVLFTGSTEVASILQRKLAERLDEHGQPPALIAETGGQNAMIVDSSALPEQAVADILSSAFDSAGQRCSALRVLCLQHEVAEPILQMLRGAMRELSLGPPDLLSTDVGPVIDEAAREDLLAYIEKQRARGRVVFQAAERSAVFRKAEPCAMVEAAEPRAGLQASVPDTVAGALAHGCFVPPTLIEVNEVSELKREVFGPVLHVVRYARDELAQLVEQINGTGYGLTLGIHTRIDETVDFISERARVGNQYVNRNMVGAVVGVQPFGGEGLSGTGPKAGGPLYLQRLLDARASAERPPKLEAQPCPSPSPQQLKPLQTLELWLGTSGEGLAGLQEVPALSPEVRAGLHAESVGFDELDATVLAEVRGSLAEVCRTLAGISPLGLQSTLPGPTGERNTWALIAREAILCVAQTDADRIFQLAHVLAAGSKALWPEDERTRALYARLPPDLRSQVRLVDDVSLASFDTALLHGHRVQLRKWALALASREGPIVSVQANASGERRIGSIVLERLMRERSVSVNTAAAGGNASLMTIG